MSDYRKEAWMTNLPFMQLVNYFYKLMDKSYLIAVINSITSPRLRLKFIFWGIFFS
jgi:hypothetical protein